MASPENIHPEKENEPRGTREVQKLPSIHRALNTGFIITESNQKEDKIYIIEMVKKRYETSDALLTKLTYTSWELQKEDK